MPLNLYLVDAIEANVDIEFDEALFVWAETPQRAAYLWEQCYERGNTVARVTLIPPTGKPPAKEGEIDWGVLHLNQTIVTL